MEERFDDLEENIKEKEDLLEQAKALASEDDLSKAMATANSLRTKWRKIFSFDSSKEEDLNAAFEQALDVVYSKKQELFKSAAAAKEDLVARAKEASENKNFKEATAKMNELMEEWKKSASAGKEKDDELWAKFNGYRQTFFDSKKEYFDNLTQKFADSKINKEALIEKAKELASSTEWKKTTEAMNNLMNEWKAAGSSGKEHDDALWEKFNGYRQEFNTAKNAYYDELKAGFEKKYDEKKDLIAKAKELVASNDFSKEASEEIKSLRDKWKEIGSAGKEHEDEIWTEFNETINTFFNNKKEASDRRHNEWVARQKDSINYKKDLINRAKRQIEYLKQDKIGALSEASIRQADEDIAYNEQRIVELEEEIKAIEEKLNA